MCMATTSHARTAPTTIAGWRIVRTLGDPDSDGIIRAIGVTEAPAFSESAGSAHWIDSGRGTGTAGTFRALIHIASSERAAGTLIAEAHARTSVAGDFVDPWIDLTRDDGHTIAIQHLQEVRSYADLVRSGQPLRAGQAVTLLAPLVETVHRAISNDVIPTNLRLQQCLLDRKGRPSFDCWRSAQLVTECPAMRADLLRQQLATAIARIVSAVLAMVPERSSSTIDEAFAPFGRGQLTGAVLDQALDALFSWAVPESVSVHDFQPNPRSSATVPVKPSTGVEVNGLLDTQPAIRMSGTPASGSLGVWWYSIQRAVTSVRPGIWLALAAVGSFVGMTGLVT